jgi:pimeloyl-ACP methyl ester carboxylesterase
MPGMRKVIFLPGAAGAASFWHAVSDLLPTDWQKVCLAWPGLGAESSDPTVRGFDDLVRLVEAELRDETSLVAQSMGGIVAMRVALRHPDKVRRLVLVATSGGVDVTGLGGADWRTAYKADHPAAASWITDDRPDHAVEIATITIPTLLLWGDSDRISPIAVGEHLLSLLPNATLRVVAGGTHSLAVDRAQEAAAQIEAHIA